MLAGQTGQAHLALCAVPIIAVKPGQLRDREFGALAGERQKAKPTVAQIEVIELAKEQIADAVSFDRITIVIALQGGICAYS